MAIEINLNSYRDFAYECFRQTQADAACILQWHSEFIVISVPRFRIFRWHLIFSIRMDVGADAF